MMAYSEASISGWRHKKPGDSDEILVGQESESPGQPPELEEDGDSGSIATLSPAVKSFRARTSSIRDDWTTPQSLFDLLHAEFGFTLDPCCHVHTAKCPQFFTRDTDGLSQQWAPARVFMNPPYGREIPRWMEKAHSESLRGALVVALVPVRSDTRWWHDHVIGAKAEVRFLKGRPRFELDGKPGVATPFPCAVIVYRPAP